MKHSTVFILAGLACILVLAAGCTSTPGTTPAVTTTAATTAVTAVPTTATAAPTTAAPVLNWTGTWNTTYTEEGNVTFEKYVMKQTGSSVTGKGNYGTSNDTISGTVNGSRLIGNWSDVSPQEAYNGTFEFVLSADKNAFTGKWANAGENLTKSNETWNGIRV